MTDSGSLFKSDVFERRTTEDPLVSAATYNLVLGLALSWGFFVNWMLVRNIPTASLQAIPMWLFIIGYFASGLFGIMLFTSSKEPAISFLGYNFVVVPVGLVVNLVVGRYSPTVVMEAIRITAGVTTVMMILGSVMPQVFEAMAPTLFASLGAMIFIELVQIFVFHHVPAWTDWVVATIFCGYIGYDWGRANRIPKTIDNAVDSAASLYLDIINLFLRVLRLLGRSRD